MYIIFMYIYVIQAVRHFFLNKLYQQTNLLYKLTITKNNNIIFKKNLLIVHALHVLHVEILPLILVGVVLVHITEENIIVKLAFLYYLQEHLKKMIFILP